MKTIIVSGSTGYIGRNLIRFLLKQGYSVYALVRNFGSIWTETENVSEICCPMEKYSKLPDLMKGEKAELFYHFAWDGTTGSQRADYTIQVKNVQYACDAALAAKEIGCKRFIATGTITENIAKQILEKNYSAQNLIYGLSKLYAHNLLDILCRNVGLEYVWAQLSNIYGGGNTTGNLISYTLTEFENGRTPTFGPCNQPYNFTHIEDVVQALYLIGTAKSVRNEYVISNGECKLLKEYLEEIASIQGKPLGIGLRADDGIEYKSEWFDNKDLKDIGYERKYIFSDGIKEMQG